MNKTEDMQKNSSRNQSSITTVIVVLMSLLMAAVSVILLFVPQLQEINICYLLCVSVVILGIYMIVRYFMTDAFQNMSEYGFSEGVLLVILGILGMIRARDLAAVFLLCMGIIVLFSGIIKLQYALDLKRMEDRLWAVLLAIAVIFLVCSIVIVLNPFNSESLYRAFVCNVMLLDALLGLVMVFYMTLRVRHFKKVQKKLEKSGGREEQQEKEDDLEKDPKPETVNQEDPLDE